jgi:hypothetical protein
VLFLLSPTLPTFSNHGDVKDGFNFVYSSLNYLGGFIELIKDSKLFLLETETSEYSSVRTLFKEDKELNIYAPPSPTR